MTGGVSTSLDLCDVMGEGRSPPPPHPSYGMRLGNLNTPTSPQDGTGVLPLPHPNPSDHREHGRVRVCVRACVGGGAHPDTPPLPSPSLPLLYPPVPSRRRVGGAVPARVTEPGGPRRDIYAASGRCGTARPDGR